MLKNNVPAPSCIPPAGLEVLTRRFVLVLERGLFIRSCTAACGSALSELHPRGGLKMLKGEQISALLFSDYLGQKPMLP